MTEGTELSAYLDKIQCASILAVPFVPFVPFVQKGPPRPTSARR
jgi:hypothetical protein